MSSSKNDEVEAKRKRCLAAAMRRAVSAGDDGEPQEQPPHEEEAEVVDLLEEPASKKPHVTQQEQWTCVSCTLLNSVSNTTCVVCGTAKNAKPRPVLDRIKITTLNVAGFETSHSAPGGFDPIETFSQELLRHAPDVICLQEATDCEESFFETLLPGYVCLGKALSHCDYAMLFIKESLAPFATAIPVDAPAVLARLVFAGDHSVVIGSCHLAPFGGGSHRRLMSMKEMLSHCHTQDKLVIVGDYNMRVKEDADFEALSVQEAWKEAGSDVAQKWTFNNIVNKFHPPGPYGASRGRYDRAYLRGFTVDEFQLFANEPLSENPRHLLSDHFGIHTVVSNADSD